MEQRDKTEIARLVCDGRWKLKHLKSFRTQFGDEALFDALYEPFDATADAEYTFNDQQIAGTLLLELQPECKMETRDVIERSLHQWNRSVEELPLYLARCFGRQAVLAAISDIEQKTELDHQATEELKTYRYWLQRLKAQKRDA